MKKTLSSLTVAVIAAFAAQGAMAQAASSPTRAEVKKETAAANKAGQIPGTGMVTCLRRRWPAIAEGEGGYVDHHARRPQEATAAANKAGEIPGTGTGNVPAARRRPAVAEGSAATSTTTRDDRKAATAAANKAGTIPQTEAQMQAPKK